MREVVGRTARSPQQAGARRRLGFREQVNGYWFILPAALTLGFLVVYPLGYGAFVSFFKTNLVNRWDFVGLSNYVQVLTSSGFLHSVWLTTEFTVGTVAGHLVIGMVLALLLNLDLPGRTAFRAILIVPWLFPEVVVAMLWKWMFNPLYGVVNYTLMSLGIISDPVTWLGNLKTAMPALIVTTIWKGYPLVMIMLLAGLQSIPREQYESAQIDGASMLQTFRYVTLPNLRSVLMVALILDTVWWFKHFAMVWVMTQGGPITATNIVSIDIYKTAFQQFTFGPASAMAILVFFICFALAGGYRLFLRDDNA